MFLKKVALPVVSTLLTLLALEGLLRFLVEPSSLYSSFHTVPELNQWNNEVEFWEAYRDREVLSLGHDPLLGWDYDITLDRIRGSRVVPLISSGDELRIVAVGDSFTYGLDVQPDENFTALLDARDDVEALNMGVAGYGIDQAYLKYMEFGRHYQPAWVIFGIYVSDYERSSLGFTAAAKPRLEVQNGKLNIVGRPVPTPQQELARIKEELSGRIYLAELARNFWHRVSAGNARRERYFAETDDVVRRVLGSLRQSLDGTGALIIVHIPRGEAFIEQDPLRDEISRRLLAIYAEVGIVPIDLTTEFVRDGSAARAVERYYVHRDNGSVGHLSAAGHAKVADLIIERLTERVDQ